MTNKGVEWSKKIESQVHEKIRLINQHQAAIEELQEEVRIILVNYRGFQEVIRRAGYR